MTYASITLCQFEQIDDLFRACLRRPEIEAVIAHPLASGEYIRTVYYRPEWALFDACVDALGYEAASAFSSATACAAALLTECLTGVRDVTDTNA